MSEGADEKITIGGMCSSKEHGVDVVNISYGKQKIAEAAYTPGRGWDIDAEDRYEDFVAKKRAEICQALTDKYNFPNPMSTQNLHDL
jgi:hypothetical protein